MPVNSKSNSARRVAGQLGGQTTRRKYGVKYFKDIGALGGQATMERHADEYTLYRQRGGQVTKRRYGREHYRQLARRSAQARRVATAQRDAVIREMLYDGWKIPSIINLTFDDLPRLKKYLSNGLGRYLEEERPDSETDCLFTSKSGRPLTLANTYKMMRPK